MFHLGIAGASHNSFYIRFVALLHHVGFMQQSVRHAYEDHRENYRSADAFHEMVFQAIESGNEIAAYETMASHIDDIQKKVISEMFDEAGGMDE